MVSIVGIHKRHRVCLTLHAFKLIELVFWPFSYAEGASKSMISTASPSQLKCDA